MNPPTVRGADCDSIAIIPGGTVDSERWRGHLKRAVLPAALVALGLGVATTLVRATPQIASAHSQRNGEVCFDLTPGLVDWRALANTALGAHVVSSPGPTLLRENYFETGEVSTLRYSVSVPPAVSGVPWLILHDVGVLAVQPSVLRGEVVYFVDRMFRVKSEPTFSGEACARQEIAGIRAAFVLSGQPAGSWSSEIVPNTTAGGNQYAVTIEGKRYSFDRPTYVFTGVRRTVVFRGSGAPLLLVVWQPDTSTCEHQYYLFEIGVDGTLRPVGKNSYGCDY